MFRRKIIFKNSLNSSDSGLLSGSIPRSINWFENQKIDKGWNLGFNTFYPKIYSIGYRGIVPDELYLSQMYITSIEQKSNGGMTKNVYNKNCLHHYK